MAGGAMAGDPAGDPSGGGMDVAPPPDMHSPGTIRCGAASAREVRGMRSMGIAGLMALAGCAASAKVGMMGPASGERPAVTARDVIAPLERAGLVPAQVTIYREDWTPAAYATVLCVDSAERVVYVAADELGRGRTELGSPALVQCRALTPDKKWLPIVPCRIYPSDAGDGWRLVCQLVALPAVGGGS
jgi:hypothetical protein